MIINRRSVALQDYRDSAHCTRETSEDNHLPQSDHGYTTDTRNEELATINKQYNMFRKFLCGELSITKMRHHRYTQPGPLPLCTAQVLARNQGPWLERVGLHRWELYYFSTKELISVYWNWNLPPSIQLNPHSKSWRELLLLDKWIHPYCDRQRWCTMANKKEHPLPPAHEMA